MMNFDRGFDFFSQNSRGMSGCWNYGSFGIWGMIIGIGFIILVIALIAWIVLNKKKENDPTLMILQDKFVRGEITEEEYLSKKRTLNLK